MKDFSVIFAMAVGSTTELPSAAITGSGRVTVPDWGNPAQRVTVPDWGNPVLALGITGHPVAEDLLMVEILPKKTYVEDVQFTMSAVVGPIICLFGVLGNVLSILTWRRPGMSSSTGRYLTGQGVANICFLLMFLLCDSLKHWFPRVVFSAVYGAVFSYFGFPIFYFSAMCSIWFTVGLTVDRYIMVCWITKAKKLCNESRATLGLVLISLNAFIINMPHFASFTPIYHDSGGYNSTEVHAAGVAFAPTTFTTGEGGQLYEFWVHCIFMILAPWTSIFFMNIMIIIKLSQANKRMADKKTSHSLKKSKESENQITRLLLTVTFSFLVFMGLQCIVQCILMKKPPGVDIMAITASYSFSVTGVLLNCSLNVVLYCLSGRRFRVELLKMLGLVSKDTTVSSTTDTSSSNVSTTVSATSTTKLTTQGM